MHIAGIHEILLLKTVTEMKVKMPIREINFKQQ